ncbi:MAG: hypothetical protein WC292_04735 [Clostridia bacterium]
MKNKLFIIIVCFAVVIPIVFAALSLTLLKSSSTPPPSVEKPLSLSDIYLPDSLRDDGLGIFFIKEESDGEMGYYKSTSAEAREIFDPTKPLIIFCHGMGLNSGRTGNEGFMRVDGWLKGGYNAAVFNWSQFSDAQFPWDLEEKMWGVNGRFGMQWMPPSGIAEKEDIPDVPLAKIFAAFYLDFMADYSHYSGREIWIAGHSMGGAMALSSVSYLVTKEAEGVIPASLLPDRVTLFDPYFSFFVNDVYIDWLDRTMGAPLLDESGEVIRENTTNAEFVAEVAKSLTARGIALEIVPTVTGVVPAVAYHMERGTAGLDALYAEAQTFQFRTDWVKDPVLTNFAESHNGGRFWYSESFTEDYIFDSAMENSEEYTVSGKMPLSVIMARRGIIYEMEKNFTPEGADDIIYSTNIDAPYVAGFAFLDTNENGAYDERIQSRLSGVRVELYLKSGAENRLLGTATTDITGFYKIEVPALYANGFDELFVKISIPPLTSITRRADKILLLNNDINPDSGASDLFIMPHRKSLIIINTGFKRG